MRLLLVEIVQASLQVPAIRTDLETMISSTSIKLLDPSSIRSGARIEGKIDLKKAITNLRENKSTKIPGMVK